MPPPRWLVVARNECRIHTSRIRKIRPYFPILVIGLLAVYVAFIAPRFVDSFIDDFLAMLLSQFAAAMVQIVLIMVFIYFMIIPITQTLREEQTEQLEIFLAAPVKPSDVLLEEFLGHIACMQAPSSLVIPAELALILAYLVFAGSALDLLLWFYLLRHYEASQVSPYLFLVPVIGGLLGWSLLGETLDTSELIGIFFVSLSIYILNKQNHLKRS